MVIYMRLTKKYKLLGTSHLVVPDDLSGLFSIIQWLSYIPRVGHIFHSVYSPTFCISLNNYMKLPLPLFRK